MAFWKHEAEREDDDDRNLQPAFDARKWMRGVADRSQNPAIRGMAGDLRALELAAGPFFLGVDYDNDIDDVDEMGPF
jgi:hypothetical protein